MHVLNYHHSTLSFDARGEDNKFKYQCVDTLEDIVKKFDRHDRWADLEMELFEECKTMRVGLQVVSKG